MANPESFRPAPAPERPAAHDDASRAYRLAFFVRLHDVFSPRPSMKPLFAPVYALVSALLAFGAMPLRAVDLQTLVDRSPFSPPAQVADGRC